MTKSNQSAGSALNTFSSHLLATSQMIHRLYKPPISQIHTWVLLSGFSAHGGVDESASGWDATWVMVRRYGADERPWQLLHNDAAEVTVNVALTTDGPGGGGLVAMFGGVTQSVTREEGEATVHSSSLLHGVSRCDHARYSLIIFFARCGSGDGSLSSASLP